MFRRRENQEAPTNSQQDMNFASSRFVMSINHEIRTPISGILGIAQLLKESQLDSQQQGQIDAIIHSAQLALSIIKDIIDIGRMEHGKLTINMNPFNIYNLIEQCVKVITPSIVKKNLDIHVKMTPDLPNVFLGDSSRIEQILLNLLSNAVKFTEKGSITVVVKKAETSLSSSSTDLIHFEVIDTGIGIKTETIPLMFEDYSQASPIEGIVNPGLGLGLSISKQLVRFMEGDMGASSCMGMGSCFWFKLPLKIADKESIASTSNIALKEVNKKEKLKILVAEDNEINQQVMTGLLDLIGDEFYIANNGQEAIDLFLQHDDVDLIFMDINMPILDGVTATQKIRESSQKGNTIPIIAITANNLSNDHEAFLQAGMTQVITKPIDKQKLIDVLYPYRSKDPFVKTQNDEKNPLSDHFLPHSSTQKLIQIETLSQLIDDLSVKKVSNLFEIYKRDVKEYLLELKNQQDKKAAKATLHTLAGMSENLGMKAIGATARTMMAAPLNDTANDLTSSIEELERIISSSIEEYETILSQKA